MARVIHFDTLAKDPNLRAASYVAVLGWTVQGPSGGMWYQLLTTGEGGEVGSNGGMMDRHFDQPLINTMQPESR